MFNRQSRRARLAIGLAGLALVAGACAPAADPEKHTIGFSNPGGVGNGWREQQLCTARAQALASGEISEFTAIHRNTDAAGQLADIRDLIAKGVDAIIINPADPDALNPALKEALDAGIVVVAVDAYVTQEGVYNLSNDQVKYAELGARWLFEKLGGTGQVLYMRGIAGHPADTDRHTGFTTALEDFPGIEVLPGPEGVHTGWDHATGTTLINDFIAGGLDFDGIWTSGIDQAIVDAIKAAGRPFVPIVGADQTGFVGQLLDTEGFPGLEGVAVSNPASVGGAGVTLALKLLAGETVETGPRNTVLLTPVAVDNVTEEGRTQLADWQEAGLDPLWPLAWEIPGWTTYTLEQAIACKGPGE
ncbi:MAG TPA: substrate-binding domain-containing protein [Patescibacteria group bacterium]|nr:substrate-binding domain-containing protein [Patescibacteria group bacterium]